MTTTTAQRSVYLLILACSPRNSGHCVAGREVFVDEQGQWSFDDEQWLRPVASANPDVAALSTAQITCSNGARACTGDVVRITLNGPVAMAGQPENWLVADQPWEWVGEVPAAWITQMAEKTASLWHDPMEDSHVVSAAWVNQGEVDHSLCLIQPENLVFTLAVVVDSYGFLRRKIYASFSYQGIGYERLSVTCPAIKKVFKNQFPELPGEVHKPLHKDDNYLLSLSLGACFEQEQKHYKLVAAVFDYDGYLNDVYARVHQCAA